MILFGSSGHVGIIEYADIENGYIMSDVITEINKKKLKELWCSSFSRLKSVPYIEGLEQLYCNICVSLKYIPNVNCLKTLNCSGCTGLLRVPFIEGLAGLLCSDCTVFQRNGITDTETYRKWIRRIKIYCLLLNPKSLTMGVLKSDLVRMIIINL
jgi:hypothetical protein